MNTIEDQIRIYTEQIDDSQMAVSVAEALALVDTVRVSDSGTPVSVERRWQGLLVAGAVGVAVMVLIGSAFLIGATDDNLPPDANATSGTTRPLPPVSSEEVETHLGTWQWERSEMATDNPVVAYNGIFYTTDSDLVWDDNFEPVADGERREDSWLLTSSDGVVWVRSQLPDEMKGLYIGFRPQQDDSLTLWGWSAAGEAPSAWTSADGVDWMQTDARPWRGSDRLGLTILGVETEGVEMRIFSDDPVLAGQTRLVQGNIFFEFPEFVQELFAAGYSNDGPLGADRGTFEGVGSDNSVVYQIDYVIEGSAIEYTFWTGRRDRGEILHTARIDMGSVALMNRLPREGLLSPSFNLLWRSPPTGGPFEVAADPFVSDDVSTARYRVGTRTITSVGDEFVLYGATSGGPTTRINEFVTRNEPSVIGAVATSADGLSWRMTAIPELVEPGSVTFMVDGRTVFDGQLNIWVSEDGVNGEVLDLPGSEPGIVMGSDELLVTGGSGTQVQISTDARTWSVVPLPQSRDPEQRSGFDFEGGRLFYAISSADRTMTTWVGHLER